MLANELLGDREDVVDAVRERRHGELDDVEAEVEVFAERLLDDCLLEVGVRRAHEPYVRLARDGAAEALVLAGLEDAQELHLPDEREVADLVEEQRASVGRLESADARLGRAREGAGLGSEELGLHQGLRQRPRVDADERRAPTRRVPLDDLGDLLLAGAVRPGDEDRRVRARDVHGDRDELVHRATAVDEAAEIEALREDVARLARLARETRVLSLELAEPQESRDEPDELRVVPGLLEVVVRALLHEHDGRLERGPRRDEDDGHLRVHLADRAKQLDALLARRRVAGEVHVLDDDGDAARAHAREGGLRRGHGLGAEPVHVEEHRERSANGKLVVYDENGVHRALRIFTRAHLTRTLRVVQLTPPRFSRTTNQSVCSFPAAEARAAHLVSGVSRARPSHWKSPFSP